MHLFRGRTVTVPAVGEVPAFKVTLRKEDPVAPDEVPLAQGTPLFVVADTHGQFETLVELLQKHRVIDVELKVALRHFGVNAILVGHTSVPTVTPLYGGKVIAVQAQSLEGLLIENGQLFRAPLSGSQPLERLSLKSVLTRTP